MPSPLRESCTCWKAEKLCRHFYRKCWTMDFRDGNLHNATLFCSNAQKSCNIMKSFLLQCNSLCQFPKITLHCFSLLSPHESFTPSQNKPIAKKWIQTHRYRAYILLPIHTCAFVTRMRHFLQWFYLLPHFFCNLFYKFQFCPLLLLGQFVTDFTGSKSTLWA